MPRRQSIARRCLAFSGLFEAEVLIELMLRHWNHPYADSKEFRANLLEGACSVLQASVAGQGLLEGISPEDVNFIAAAWYAEWNTLENSSEPSQELRRAWLDNVRRSVPSCFCPPDLLGG